MKAPIPGEQEELIYEFIVKNYLLEELLNNRKDIRNLGFKIPEVYEHLLDEVISIIQKEIIKIRKEFRELDIKVDSVVVVDDMFVEYPYYARGYQGIMRFWVAALDLKVNKRLDEYFKSFKK